MSSRHETKFKLSGLRSSRLAFITIPLLAAGLAQAQVPPDIEAGLRKIGQIVDPGCTAKLYRPLMPVNDINSDATPLYPGVTIARDVSFGVNPKDVVDIFSGEKGGGSRTVLLYVPGGQGDKIEQQVREANAFYDNIGRWGTKNGMVVVLMQRHASPSWDGGGKDISTMIQWVQANISKYKGNPERMFIWTQSAGNGPLGVYIGRPELYGPKGVGVKGAIFMSGQFNILPLKPDNPQNAGGNFAGRGAACDGPPQGVSLGIIKGPGADAPPPVAAAEGREGEAKGKGKGKGKAGGGAAPPDEATLLARSSLPGLKEAKIALLFANAELDPGISGSMSPFYQTLHDELCKEGPTHCPTMLFEKGESHMSEVFSIGTSDLTVSKPILDWMKKVK